MYKWLDISGNNELELEIDDIHLQGDIGSPYRVEFSFDTLEFYIE